MKKILCALFFLNILFQSPTVHAQYALKSLNENFDVKCATSTFVPTKWWYYNPIWTTDPMGAWQCSSSDGRAATPGVKCTGIYGTPATYHLDTSYLLTPKLNIDTFSTAAPVYFRFDTKNTTVHLGARLSVEYRTDTPFKTGVFTDITPGITPVFGNDDSTGWVTHEVDISALRGADFYIAFRYTSTTTTGSIWYLDNVTMSRMSVASQSALAPLHTFQVSLGEHNTHNEVTINYETANAGPYNVVLYDMMGREQYNRTVELRTGNGSYTIYGLSLSDGMYYVRVSDGKNYGGTNVMIR